MLIDLYHITTLSPVQQGRNVKFSKSLTVRVIVQAINKLSGTFLNILDDTNVFLINSETIPDVRTRGEV